ncbi:MAG: shikimate dehydrogenase [Acidimicrobiia bacterium]|nr:shikimate dehydrogenase [Acidimicrobiia bacterium]MBT8215773.1 shikimate dehydrogenase [Acidimicrobiia bacterium]NNF09407.1 shikimate dehydrogenase [Acidimicrobiia bacterium]NNL70406.1 shikimate dehydrogenase [Acidimicrobiia bacterium]
MLNYVVLGDPVAHSLSPRLHTAALAAVGIEGAYTARRVDAAGFMTAVDEIRSGALAGANVTMPHKQLAARAADELSDNARRAGSVNTLVLRTGVLRGETTDVGGIRDAWGDLPGGPVLILGAGGAAAAAVLALEGRPLSVAARRREAAQRLVARTRVDAQVIEWGRPCAGCVVVNATPIGMGDEQLPAEVLEAASGLFDMPYGTGETASVTLARRLGIPVVAGAEMLLHQAARSFECWTGVQAPLAAMRAALSSDHSARSNT